MLVLFFSFLCQVTSEFSGGRCSPAGSVVLPAPLPAPVVLLLPLLRGVVFGAWFSAARLWGRGIPLGGLHVSVVLARGVKPSGGWALQQTLTPTRRALAAHAAHSRPASGSGRPLPAQGGRCCSGEAFAQPPPPPPCPRSHPCCRSPSSPAAFGAQSTPGRRSWAPLPSLVLSSSFKHPWTQRPGARPPRSSRPGSQSLGGLATLGLTGPCGVFVLWGALEEVS